MTENCVMGGIATAHHINLVVCYFVTLVVNVEDTRSEKRKFCDKQR